MKTPNLNLNVPDYRDLRWDIPVNENWNLIDSAVAEKQDIIPDLEEIRSNAQAGKDIIPQVEVNTQRIEDLTVARFPNVVVKGTPQIIGGQVSGFSATNYLQFPFVDISRGYPFDIYFSFTTAEDVTTQQNILDSYYGIALAIQNGKGLIALSSNGTSWDIGTATGTNTLTPNTTYYVKCSWTGTAYTAALSQDDQSYVPDMNIASSVTIHKTTIFIGGSPELFGAGSAHPFKGTINFNNSRVVVNGLTVWEGMSDVGLASRANVSLNNLDEVGEARFTNILNETGSTLDYTGTTLSLENANGDMLSSVTIKSTPDLDNLSINLNGNSQLQTVAVINQNNPTTAIKTWTGTKDQYDAIEGKDPNTLYNITDDTDVSMTILEALYPVGSIYITTAATCPLSALISGSTWVLVSSGRVLQGADSSHSAGTTIEAGLPNITGSLYNVGTLYQDIGIDDGVGAGAIEIVKDSHSRKASGNIDGYNNNNLGWNFDASRSSTIYGNSSTVQPLAYVVNIYRRTA